MSRTPILQPPPQLPPPAAVTQQAHPSHSGHGSVGPVIGVLAIITILSAIAIMIGRLCSGRRIMDHGQYDVEGWAEAKCSSCLDGRVDPPPPQDAVKDVPAADPSEIREERQNPRERAEP